MPSGLFYHLAILWTVAFVLLGALPVLYDALGRHRSGRGFAVALRDSAYIGVTLAMVLILLGCVVGAGTRVFQYMEGGDPNEVVGLGIGLSAALIISGGWFAVRVGQRKGKPWVWWLFNVGLLVLIAGWLVSL